MADEAIFVNGNMMSWGSIRLKINGDLFAGFTSISYGDKRERVKAYGMGRHHAPRGRSRGKYTVEPVKITGAPASVQAAREALAAAAPDGKSYGDVEFQVVVQYTDTGEAGITVEIEKCTWVTNTTSNEESADPLKEEFELDAMYIRRNGLVLFDTQEATL